MKTYLIGICGRSGSGKSTICGYYSRAGVRVIDCDKIAREVYEDGGDCLYELKSAFGQDIIGTDGALDRAALSGRAFASKEKAALLNSITHKYIIARIEAEIERCEKNGEKLIIIDAPLLFEAGLDKMTDAVIAVVSKESDLRERVMKRDGKSEAEIETRLSRQLSSRFLIMNSDFCVINDNSVGELRKAAFSVLLCVYIRFGLIKKVRGKRYYEVD